MGKGFGKKREIGCYYIKDRRWNRVGAVSWGVCIYRMDECKGKRRYGITLNDFNKNMETLKYNYLQVN